MKQVVTIIIMMLGVSFNGFSQPIPVDSIVAFYKNVDVECYKEKINRGMKDFDKWLTDTFPQLTILHSPYSPSDIDLREHNAIPIVALKYYNMKNISENEDIYDHLIIDSSRCVILIPLDEKNNPLGITDVIGDTYSYLSFQNKENMHYYHAWGKLVNKYLKICRKVAPDAYVYIDDLYPRFGYVLNGKILLVMYKQKRPIELSEFVKEIYKRPGAHDLFRKSDRIHESEREYWNTESSKQNDHKLTGHTPKERLRLCFEKFGD